MASTGSTTSRLRDDIDHGRTGDKVPAPDPAAAPLGTDDEAAGLTAPPRAAAAARQAELHTGALVKAERIRPRRRPSAAIVALLAAAVAVLAFWIWRS